jgi:3-carboxy-cis,cis-muconate cycloisomerase
MIQEHERAAGAWQSEWPTLASVIQATGSTLAAVADSIGSLTVRADRMRANLAATDGAIFAEKAAALLAPHLGRSAAQLLVSGAVSGQSLREGLAKLPQATALLSPEQIASIDRPEDYLGAAEVFRRRLLESPD